MRAAFLLPLALAACAALANPLDPLPEGGGWRVTAIAGAPVPTGAEVTIERPDSRGISGRAGCNRYGGQISATGARLKIGPLMATEMFCVDLMTVEQAFFAALDQVDSARSTATGVELLAGDRVVITATKQVRFP
ncbi:META domain-containing protein [Phaeovulum veldkampii]|nr:META domain-containing protein [Phaeovulum veldkampii]TDQ62203.1 heat shock protein HslJ [Phaeovulum veldkampii DSM 11550]